MARFLDTAYGFLKTGYFEEPANYNFDACKVCPAAGAESGPELGGSPQPCAGEGGRGDDAAVRRKMSGNSAPLMDETAPKGGPVGNGTPLPPIFREAACRAHSLSCGITMPQEMNSASFSTLFFSMAPSRLAVSVW